MPALTPDGLGLKALTFYPPNAERGIPTHMTTILLADPATGAPLAIMDGRLITEMRTAAVSAAAVTGPTSCSRPGSGASAAGTTASLGRDRSAARSSNPGMRRQAIIGEQVF